MRRTIGEVINQIEAIFVVDSGKVGLGDGEAYTISKSLSERAGRDFDTCRGNHFVELESAMNRARGCSPSVCPASG